jgi:uncharacterized protein
MKKRWITIALALPLALGFALDNGLPYALIDHANRPVEERSTLWNDAKVEALEFVSRDGTRLAGWWVGKPDAKQTVILLHTLGGNRGDLLEFAEPIWKEGFNVVLLDLRSHGMSEGKYFTYGFHEWQDVMAAIDVVSAKQPDQTIAILGVSAGGTVAISAAARDERIRKVVTIGTFADLGETIEAQTKWLPEGLRRRAIGRSEELANFKVAETSARRWIGQVKVPVMIAHGETDSYIPISNGEQLFTAAREPKVFFKIAGANHDSMLRWSTTDRRSSQDLQREVIRFLRVQ